MTTKSSCPTCPFRFQPSGVFLSHWLLLLESTAMVCFGGEHGALSCSSAEGRQARGWRQQPHSAQSGSGARWPLAALPEHPSPPRPRSAEPLGLAASRVHLPEEHAGVPRHKKPSGSAGTAHPTGMRAGPHNPGQKIVSHPYLLFCISSLSQLLLSANINPKGN